MNRHQQRFITGLRLAADLSDHRSEVVLPAYARRIDFLLPSVGNPLDLQVLSDISAAGPLAIEHVSSAASVVDAASAEMAQRWLYLQWRRFRTRQGRATMQADAAFFDHPHPSNTVVIAQRVAWTTLIPAYPTHWLSHEDSVLWLPGPENSGVSLIDSARLPSDIGGDVLRWLTASDPVHHKRYLEVIMNNPNISEETKLRINKGVIKQEDVFTSGERDCVVEKLKREGFEEGLKEGQRRARDNAEGVVENLKREGREQLLAEMRQMHQRSFEDAGMLHRASEVERMSDDEFFALIASALRASK